MALYPLEMEAATRNNFYPLSEISQRDLNPSDPDYFTKALRITAFYRGNSFLEEVGYCAGYEITEAGVSELKAELISQGIRLYRKKQEPSLRYLDVSVDEKGPYFLLSSGFKESHPARKIWSLTSRYTRLLQIQQLEHGIDEKELETYKLLGYGLEVMLARTLRSGASFFDLNIESDNVTEILETAHEIEGCAREKLLRHGFGA